jgi:hypothetical protein
MRGGLIEAGEVHLLPILLHVIDPHKANRGHNRMVMPGLQSSLR